MHLTDRSRSILRLMTGLALLSVGLQSAVQASTLINADRVSRKILVIKGDSRTPQTLEPGAVIKEICKDGCIVRIDEDANRDFVLEGTERVTIEGGLLYYDGELSKPVPGKPSPN